MEHWNTHNTGYVEADVGELGMYAETGGKHRTCKKAHVDMYIPLCHLQGLHLLGALERKMLHPWGRMGGAQGQSKQIKCPCGQTATDDLPDLHLSSAPLQPCTPREHRLGSVTPANSRSSSKPESIDKRATAQLCTTRGLSQHLSHHCFLPLWAQRPQVHGPQAHSFPLLDMCAACVSVTPAAPALLPQPHLSPGVHRATALHVSKAGVHTDGNRGAIGRGSLDRRRGDRKELSHVHLTTCQAGPKSLLVTLDR